MKLTTVTGSADSEVDTGDNGKNRGLHPHIQALKQTANVKSQQWLRDNMLPPIRSQPLDHTADYMAKSSKVSLIDNLLVRVSLSQMTGPTCQISCHVTNDTFYIAENITGNIVHRNGKLHKLILVVYL